MKQQIWIVVAILALIVLLRTQNKQKNEGYCSVCMGP